MTSRHFFRSKCHSRPVWMMVKKRQFLMWPLMLEIVTFHFYPVCHLSFPWGPLSTTNTSPLRSHFKESIHALHTFMTEVTCGRYSTAEQYIFWACGQRTALADGITMLITFLRPARRKTIPGKLNALSQAQQIIRCARKPISEQSAPCRVGLKRRQAGLLLIRWNIM